MSKNNTTKDIPRTRAPYTRWTDDEMIITLDLYFKLTFGRLNRGTPEVIQLANLIGKTSNAVAMRLTNFAACDPYIVNSGRHGLEGGRKKCLPFWNYYSVRKNELVEKAAVIRARLENKSIEQLFSISPSDFVGREKEVVIKQRIHQDAFRMMILNNYNQHCAVTGIGIPQLLVASHIIPWADDENERLNPENGICLSSLYDKAFDRGLIGVDTNYKIILSGQLKEYHKEEYFDKHFSIVENQKLILPEEHKPDKDFLEYHMRHVFLGR